MFSFFKDATPRSKKIAQSFLSTAKFIAKYFSERFLSICGVSEGLLKFCKLISNLILGQIIDSDLSNVHKLAA